MFRRLIALFRRNAKPRLPRLDPPIRITCVNLWRALPPDALRRIHDQQDAARRSIEAYALIGYAPDGLPFDAPRSDSDRAHLDRFNTLEPRTVIHFRPG